MVVFLRAACLLLIGACSSAGDDSGATTSMVGTAGTQAGASGSAGSLSAGAGGASVAGASVAGNGEAGAAGSGGAAGSVGMAGSAAHDAGVTDASVPDAGDAGEAVDEHVPPHPGTIARYENETPFQRGVQAIEVLLPSSYDRANDYRVLYVLPVAPGGSTAFGDGLRVLAATGAHDTYELILVQMTFQDEPWFGDHATDSLIRQVSYLREHVVPFIERSYSVDPAPESRLLIGFSKSGWGAISLILKSPDFWGYALSWDAPLMFDSFYYEMESIYGTQARLDQFRPDLLAAANASRFADEPRLVIAGEDAWGSLIPPPGGGSHTVRYHELLEGLGISHVYDPNIPAEHNWNATWAEPALGALMSLVE